MQAKLGKYVDKLATEGGYGLESRTMSEAALGVHFDKELSSVALQVCGVVVLPRGGQAAVVGRQPRCRAAVTRAWHATGVSGGTIRACGHVVGLQSSPCGGACFTADCSLPDAFVCALPIRCHVKLRHLL